MAQHGVCVMLLLLLPYFAAHRLPFPHQTKANRANGRYNSRPLLSSLERTAHIYKIRNYNMLPQSQSSFSSLFPSRSRCCGSLYEFIHNPPQLHHPRRQHPPPLHSTTE